MQEKHNEKFSEKKMSSQVGKRVSLEIHFEMKINSFDGMGEFTSKLGQDWKNKWKQRFLIFQISFHSA